MFKTCFKKVICDIYHRIFQQPLTTLVGMLLIIIGITFLTKDDTTTSTFLIGTGAAAMMVKDPIKFNKNNNE